MWNVRHRNWIKKSEKVLLRFIRLDNTNHQQVTANSKIHPERAEAINVLYLYLKLLNGFITNILKDKNKKC